MVMCMNNQKKNNYKKYSTSKRKNAKTNTKALVTKKSSSKEQAWFSDMNQIDWYPIDPYCD